MFDKKMWLEWIGNKMENDVAQKEARSSYDFTQNRSLHEAINEVINRKTMKVEEFRKNIQPID
jgi:hypothetical protein|tara:strand:- start:664 stop:852 length:189 start_codon:yes stop_codon:yes gene_type:complete